MNAPAIKPTDDPEQTVRDANRSFYRAFAELELERMEELWLQESWVECVHPGWDLLIGWNEVRESWARIFANTRRVQIEISSEWVRVEGTVAWVACTEHVTSNFDHGFDQVRVQATNIFVLRPAQGTETMEPRWYMVAHHGSPLVQAAPAPLQ